MNTAKDHGEWQALLQETPNTGTLPDAKACPHGCACGKTGDCGEHPLCEVTYDIGVNVLSLATTQQITCPYRVSYGFGEICCCPRHYVIYLTSGH